MDKKVIFFDGDGTIVDRNNISKQTLDALKKLKDKGHILVLNTGRSLALIQDIIKQLPIDNVICSSGGIVMINEKIIWEKYMSYTHLKEITDYFDQHELIYNLECNDFIYIQKGSKEKHLKRAHFLNNESTFEELSQRFDERYIELENLQSVQVNKIHWFEDDALYINQAPLNYKTISEKFKDRYHIIPLVGNALSKSGEISEKGITKQKGMQVILDYYQISKDNSYAIGDDWNDKEMLEYAAHAIAMGQAPEEIKKICEFVTDDVKHDGFAKAMEYFNLIDKS